MTSKKMIIMVAIIGVVASLIGGMVVYAAISNTLNITGSAEFQPESWSVKFKGSSLSAPVLTGGATIDTAPTLADTLVGNFKVILTQPGDSATYTFSIENTGSLDAVLSTYSPTSPTCTGTVGDSKVADETLLCGSGNLLYTLNYAGGSLAENGLTLGQAVTQGDQLKAATEVQVELKLQYSSDATGNPAAAVTIGGLDRTLIYSVYQGS